MSEPLQNIQAGTPCTYRLEAGRGHIGVFEKIFPGGRSVYVLTREPSSKAPGAPPASILREVTDKAEALAALHRLSRHLPLPRRRRRRGRTGAGQGELQLGPFQTREQYRSEMLRRQLEKDRGQ
jgi:hypothetical protein